MKFYELVIDSHIIVSTVFMIIAILIVVRSIRGWRLKKAYTKFDRNLSIVFLVFLYVQLILGLLLYFVLGNRAAGAVTMEEATEQMALRFWVLEHFVFMIFALFLSQLGWIFIRKSKLDSNKHRNELFYFGGSILLILISIGIRLIWK